MIPWPVLSVNCLVLIIPVGKKRISKFSKAVIHLCNLQPLLISGLRVQLVSIKCSLLLKYIPKPNASIQDFQPSMDKLLRKRRGKSEYEIFFD